MFKLLPNNHHVARYCAPKHIKNNEIQSTAFLLKKHERSLSVNWLENIHSDNREIQLGKLRNVYRIKNLNNPKGKITILNIGKTCDIVKKETEDKRELKFVHEPSDSDPSHAGIHNLNQDDMFISELILETVNEVYPSILER